MLLLLLLLCKNTSKTTRSFLLPTTTTTTSLLRPIVVAAFAATARPHSTATTTSTSSSPLSIFPLAAAAAATPDLDPALVSSTFKEWFSRACPYTIFDQIFDIISTSLDADDDFALDAALSSLRLRLDESFVLQALRHLPRPRPLKPPLFSTSSNSTTANNLLLLRLKFFDWAGRQGGFRHTRSTYHAIFKLLSQARLVSVVVDWLQAFAATRHHHHLSNFLHRRHVRFHDTLVVGYAVAGKPDVALQLFARMRYQGLDLDAFSYHVLLNALVEESAFDVADAVLSQISARGLANPVTSCIRMKSLCKQNRLDEAAAFLRELDGSGVCGEGRAFTDRTIGILVDALCKNQRFEEASQLVEEFGSARAYDVWIRDLIDAGRIDGAMNFLYGKKSLEGYIPEVFSYNKLICQLLRENRLAEAYDVLVEMQEEGIAPDKVTMNAALCFFCKAGMVDVALQLYNSRLEFGLSPNSLAYNHLINALCTKEDVDEVCQILEDSLKQGYFPGKQTFDLLAEMLCRKGKLDKMGKLLEMALERDFIPKNSVCARYISELCRSGRTEEGYLTLQKVNGTQNVLSAYAYTSLIRGFMALGRGDMVCKLLIEMQENGHSPTRYLYRKVICCLCEMGNLEQVLNLLETQLALQELDQRTCYSYFIDGAGHAKNYELAREVFLRMKKVGIEPNVETSTLMLQSYLKSRRIGDALNFFYGLRKEREASNRLYSILIVGLCKAGRPDQALLFWREVRGKGLIPTLQCYEELVHALCSCGDYDTVVKVLQDFEKTGREVSSFICNVLLLHTLKTQELRRVWAKQEVKEDAEPGDVSSEVSDLGRLMLGQLVSAFSGGIRIKDQLDNLEEVVEKHFPVNVFTYNLLLRALSMEGRMDCACDLFSRMCKKGREPNRWTYDIILYGLCKNGRKKDAERWKDEMISRGFYPTWYTMDFFNNTSAKRQIMG